MGQQNLVEQYLVLMDKEKDLKMEYEAAKKKRVEARDNLARLMDSGGVSGYFGVAGEKVSITHYHRVKVVDYGALMRWMEETGVKAKYVVERFRLAQDKQTGAPGLRNILDEARYKSKESGQAVEEFLPPGMGHIVESGLRITQPKATNDHAFDDASRSVVEMLKETK